MTKEYWSVEMAPEELERLLENDRKASFKERCDAIEKQLGEMPSSSGQAQAAAGAGWASGASRDCPVVSFWLETMTRL